MPLGVLLKDESQHDDMISILEKLQEYSPQLADEDKGVSKPTGDRDEDTEEYRNNTSTLPILLGGDQFSTSMARRVIADRVNSRNDIECLKGVQPVVEDWHAKLCFLTVSC